jgi:hypothetical protein
VLSRPRTRRIEFLCAPEDVGVIAEPVPARAALPAWFRRLPGLDREVLDHRCNGLTVKRCVPFLDALTSGWIVPLAATVRLEVSDGGATVHAGWEFDRELVSPHHGWQAAGNPWEPRALMKFHNPWAIRTPPGWSCLVTAPLNRANDVVQVLSGVVDTDRYQAPVNFPFVTIAGEGVHTLEKGTPLVQVIPFQRTELEASVRAEIPVEADERERQHRATLAGSGHYRALRSNS